MVSFNRRGVGALGFALVAMLLAAGCQLGASTQSTNQKLVVWTYRNSWVPGIQAAADAWNKKTGNNVTVDVQTYAEADGVYANKVAAATRAHQLPDLVTAYGPQWEYVGNGVFQDLTPKLDSSYLSLYPQSILNDYIKFSQQLADGCQKNPDCTYKGEKVGQIGSLPQISGATGFIFARKDKLAAAGLDPNTPPKSYEEWIDMMKKTVAKDNKGGGLVMPLKVPESGYLWLFKPLLFTVIGPDAFQTLYNKGGNWNSSEVQKAFALYDQLSPLWSPGVLQVDNPAPAFTNGLAAWTYGGTYTYPDLIQGGLTDKDMLIFPLPVPAGASEPKLLLKPWVSGWLGLSKDSKNSALALDFLKFYLSPGGAVPFASASHDNPSVTLPPGSSQSPLTAATSLAYGAGKDAFDEIRAYGPACAGAKTLNNQVSVALTQLLSKEKGPSGVARDFQDIFNKAWTACS